MSNQASLGDIAEDSTPEDGLENLTQENYLQLGPDKLNIPESWGKTKFGDIFTHQRGVSYSGDNYVEEGEGMVFLTLNAIAPGGGLKKNSLKHYDDDISEKRKVKPGDILMANTDLNQDGEIIGYPVKVPDFDLDQKLCFSHHLLKIEQQEELFNEQFIEFLFSSNYIHSRMISFSCGSTVLNLNTNLLEKLELPVPEKAEQRRIASVLYNVDQAIQKTEEIIEQIQRVKKGLMQDLFTEGYYSHEEFQEARIGPKKYRIPSGWTTEPIGDLGEVITGDTPSTDDEDNFGDKYPFVTPEDLKDNKYITDVRRGLTDKGMGETKEIPENSVMMDCIGSDLGKVAISKRKLATNQQINSIVPGEEFDPEFLYYSLQFISEILKAQAGATATPIVRKSSFSALELFKPKKEEQEKIGSTLKALDDKTAQLREEKEQLQRLKKGLMQDLLTGEVRTSEDVEVLDEVVEVENE